MPEDNPAPADSSVRMVASNTINYAVILSLLGALLYGVWWTAHRDAAFEALTATVAAQNIAMNKRIDDSSVADNLRISRIADSITERMGAMEKRDEERRTSLAVMDNRLTRIESKLDFLTTNITGGQRK